jgi:anti-anti-sigma regulatory factor
MEIRSSANGDKLDMKLIGRLDTSTAPQLESA